jgi:hypothetical protein
MRRGFDPGCFLIADFPLLHRAASFPRIAYSMD